MSELARFKPFKELSVHGRLRVVWRYLVKNRPTLCCTVITDEDYDAFVYSIVLMSRNLKELQKLGRNADDPVLTKRWSDARLDLQILMTTPLKDSLSSMLERRASPRMPSVLGEAAARWYDALISARPPL